MVKMELDRRALAQFKRTLKEYEKKTGIAIEDAVIEMAKSTGRRLAHTVPPYGLSSSVGKKFMDSIGTQVDRAWYGSIKGAYPSSSMEAAHRAARNNRGVVPKRQFRQYKGEEMKISVTEKETYKHRIQKNAGIAKAGWVVAAEKTIGKQSLTKRGAIKKLSGIANWIRRNAKDKLGSSKVVRRGISTSVDLTNHVTYITPLHKPSEQARAIKQGYNNAIRRMNHIINGTRRNQTI